MLRTMVMVGIAVRQYVRTFSVRNQYEFVNSLVDTSEVHVSRALRLKAFKL